MHDVATTPGGRHRARLSVAWWPEAVLFVVALLVRLIPEMFNGAVTGNYGYDPAVYYAAADSFLHGRMPYRDFILLHPPGIVLVETPFAWFGSLTSDRLGFAAVNGFFVVLSAVSAVLVTRVARRLGLPRVASLLAGAVYALYFGSLMAEYEARLEPLGCFLLLCGLLALLAAQERTGRSATVLALVAGIALGTAMSIKIWWALPVLVLLGWELVALRAVRRVAAALAGLVTALVLINGPFFLVAGSKMWTMVVLDQVGRPRNTPTVLRPLAFLAVGWPSVRWNEEKLKVAVLFGAVVLVFLVSRAWRVRRARVIVLLLLAQIALIAAEPTWYQFYADYLTVALSLTVGASFVRREAATDAPRRTRSPVTRDASVWVAAVVAVCLAAAITRAVPERILVRGVPAARLAAATRGYRCPMIDTPMALIDLNLLTPELRRGCANLVDTTGLLIVLEHRYGSRQRALPIWNKELAVYLRSGDAALFFSPPPAIAITAATARLVERDGPVATVGPYTIYRVLPGTTVNRNPVSIGG